jgi:hypothetical protein
MTFLEYYWGFHWQAYDAMTLVTHSSRSQRAAS